MINLFKDIHNGEFSGVKGKLLGTNDSTTGGVWGKVVDYEGLKQEDVVEDFDKYLA